MRTMISKLILRMGGWKIVDEVNGSIKKCVVIGAPHTSNWDFIYALPALRVMGIKNLRYLIKKEFFYFPIKYLFYATGGIPVDRSKKNDLTAILKKLLEERDELYLLFPPEGTRKKVARWKTGFYYTALDAQLPIVLGFMDYKKRELGFGKVLTPSGDFEADMQTIEDFYLHKTAKHPELYNPRIFIRE
jgi:1-acyl-sn-glycerol-3-phosphate acyltransferase